MCSAGIARTYVIAERASAPCRTSARDQRRFLPRSRPGQQAGADAGARWGVRSGRWGTRKIAERSIMTRRSVIATRRTRAATK
jgi:hypothetical protein